MHYSDKLKLTKIFHQFRVVHKCQNCILRNKQILMQAEKLDFNAIIYVGE